VKQPVNEAVALQVQQVQPLDNAVDAGTASLQVLLRMWLQPFWRASRLPLRRAGAAEAAWAPCAQAVIQVRRHQPSRARLREVLQNGQVGRWRHQPSRASLHCSKLFQPIPSNLPLAAEPKQEDWVEAADGGVHQPVVQPGGG